jgi:general secretion pathway protein F
MPVFEYIALNKQGNQIKGVADAINPFAARQKLRENGVFPVEIREIIAEKTEGRKTRSRPFEKVKQTEVTLFTRQLATLIGAGLPLVPSLTTLASQITSPQLKKVLIQIKEDVQEGNSLVQSLSHYS